jgi:predicted transposase/invertase (TIGR01784 family)
MYDNICKFIAANFTSDLVQWLIGQTIPLTIPLTILEPTELNVEPIRADSLIFLQSEEIILHIEFQTSVSPDIPFRMADYFIRIHRCFPTKQIYQVVIYLKKSNSELTRQQSFQFQQLQHRYQVIRLWEVPTQELLSQPGLLPFAVLSQTDNPTEVLTEVAQRIETITDTRERNNLAASTAIIAGLVLDRITIKRLLRDEIMKESVIYQEIEAIGQAKGLEQGKQQGLEQGLERGLEQGRQKEVNLIIKLLNRRIGDIPPQLTNQINNLSTEQLESLGEALLDFNSQTDLLNWLESTNLL